MRALLRRKETMRTRDRGKVNYSATQSLFLITIFLIVFDFSLISESIDYYFFESAYRLIVISFVTLSLFLMTTKRFGLNFFGTVFFLILTLSIDFFINMFESSIQDFYRRFIFYLFTASFMIMYLSLMSIHHAIKFLYIYIIVSVFLSALSLISIILFFLFAPEPGFLESSFRKAYEIRDVSVYVFSYTGFIQSGQKGIDYFGFNIPPVTSIFIEPNQFAFFIMPAFAMLVYYNKIGALICGLAIFFTFSAAGVLLLFLLTMINLNGIIFLIILLIVFVFSSALNDYISISYFSLSKYVDLKNYLLLNLKFTTESALTFSRHIYSPSGDYYNVFSFVSWLIFVAALLVNVFLRASRSTIYLTVSFLLILSAIIVKSPTHYIGSLFMLFQLIVFKSLYISSVKKKD